MSVADTNMQRLNAAVADWNSGWLDKYLTFYDDSIWLHGYGPQSLDKAGVRALYEEFLRAFPGAQVTLNGAIARFGRESGISTPENGRLWHAISDLRS